MQHSFLSGPFYVLEVFTKFIEQPYNQYFLTLRQIDCFSPIYFVLFLEFCSVLSFRTCFFVSLFWQPLYTCFYALGSVTMSPRLGGET